MLWGVPMARDSSDADYDVVIVGAGTAGLAAAAELRRRGVGRVLVLDREAEAGGTPRHCAHPPFGIREYGRLMKGPAYARRNLAVAEGSGAEIRTRVHAVSLLPGGRVVLATPSGSSEVSGRRVLLCLGARETARSERLIGGMRPIGVINTGALQSAVNLKHLRPFERPLILGTELVSLSAILTCHHAGIRPVAMVEPAARPVARFPLTLFPRLMGLPLYLGAEVLAIEGGARVEAAMLRLGDGSTRRIACDGVLLTGHFTPESALLRLSDLAIDAGTGGPVTDQFGRCSDPIYFAAGNLLRPIETSGWCWREAQRIAGYIAADLTGGLPVTEDTVPIRVAGPVRYALPQKLVAGATETVSLQLRVSCPVRGTLRATQGGRVLVARPGAYFPERRTLLHLPAHLRPDAPVEIDIRAE